MSSIPRTVPTASARASRTGVPNLSLLHTGGRIACTLTQDYYCYGKRLPKGAQKPCRFTDHDGNHGYMYLQALTPREMSSMDWTHPLWAGWKEAVGRRIAPLRHLVKGQERPLVFERPTVERGRAVRWMHFLDERVLRFDPTVLVVHPVHTTISDWNVFTKREYGLTDWGMRNGARYLGISLGSDT